jgi:F-box interacting protein
VGKFVSGTINWAIKDQEKVSSWVILSLDLGNESYQKIMQPDFGLADPLHDFRLGVSRDCLCILAHTKDLLDFWVMKDYGNKDSWSKLFTVPFTELGYNGVDFVNLVYISEEHGLVFLDLCYKVYVYNYKNRTVQIPEIQDLPSTRFTSNYVYIESLISP